MLAIKAARLLCHSAAEIIEQGVVIVDGDRIVKARPWKEIEATLSKEIPVKDLGNVTLMPGLFDCHVHLQMDPSSINTSTVSSLTDEEMIHLMVKNASKLLDAGVTTARDLGSRGITAITIRDRIRSGEIAGPRMQVANAPITVPNGHACAMGGVAQGVHEVRAEVRRRAAEGADVIKVMATGGYMTAGSHPSKARYSVEELEAIVDEAKKFGIPVTTHATGSEGIERAVEARLDSIEHCAWVTGEGTTFDERIARKIVEYGIAVCPTMNTACVEHNYFCPWDSRKAVLANLSALRNMGAKLIVGTDAGIGLCHFERYADGLSALADAGYTSREIIAGATDVAASVCGLSNETGKITPGFCADLAAFDGDPLEDVNAFSRPRFVMARGKEHILSPILPAGDVAEAAAMISRVLRKGAGLAAETIAVA